MAVINTNLKLFQYEILNNALNLNNTIFIFAGKILGLVLSVTFLKKYQCMRSVNVIL